MKTLTPAAKALITVPFEKLKNTKAWKITSQLVRLLADGKCYTCDHPVPFKKMVAGHGVEKRGHAGIYFDLDCIRGQCSYCNRRKHGNHSEFARRLIEEIGAERFKEMHKRAGKSKKWNKLELEEIYQDRKKKVEALEKK